MKRRSIDISATTTGELMDQYDRAVADGTIGPIFTAERGAYEIRGDGETTGDCAAGDGPVNAGEAFVIRYHPTTTGGIFHQRCEPLGAGWFALDDTGDVMDV